MKNYIYSKTTDKGQQSFFLVVNGQEYYLFTQKFYRGVKNYFQNKVLLSKAIDFSSANNDTALLRTMEKLPAHIRYVEPFQRKMLLRREEDSLSHAYKCH